MTLREFAKAHRLRDPRRDTEGSMILPGKYDSHIYVWDANTFGLIYMSITPRACGNRRRAAIAAGMQIRQLGDSEFCATFDPTDTEKAKVAIEIAKVKRKRRLSPEQRAAKAAILARVREEHQKESKSPQEALPTGSKAHAPTHTKIDSKEPPNAAA